MGNHERFPPDPHLPNDSNQRTPDSTGDYNTSQKDGKIEVLQNLFRSLDKDGSGKLEVSDLKVIQAIASALVLL